MLQQLSVASVYRLSLCVSVTLCIVAKRCVLEQKLLLTAYRKSYMRNSSAPKNTLTFVYRSFKVMSFIASHSSLNICETVRDGGLVPKDH